MSGAHRAAPDPATAPKYRRALWTAALLNAGFGVIEMTGGVLSGSQALKADALDFLGDGLITGLAVVALGWPPKRRARVALLQAWFLAALGLGVLITTAMRVLVTRQPEADVMGWLGATGLAINLSAAAVLIPYRNGDVNARAVWLFSRNDALGNIAVVVAAIFVAITDTAWPDLIVAFVIATLFLQSAWSIMRRAKTTMTEHSAAGR